MADVAQKHMMASFVRWASRPLIQLSHPLRYLQRPIATAGAHSAQDVSSEQPSAPAWQSHRLDPANIDEPSRKRRRTESIGHEPEPRPFSSFLTDNYARQHNYLRISVTERCNLRCLYCMPEEGIKLSQPEHNLSTPEIVYLSELFVKQGVNKIRLTGGEPTVRRDIVSLMQQIGQLRSMGLRELCITTNGISLSRKLDAMVEAGLTGVNLSLDTLDPFQFTLMTRRNGYDAVLKSIHRILDMNKMGAGIKLKINCVVMKGLNEREVVPFVELGREKDLEVRFIEYMPFDGNKWSENKMVSYKEMLSLIKERFPDVHRVQDHPNDTSKTYRVPGFAGTLGFITSMTHNFCGTCNRLRITSDGNLKVCLFGNAEVSLRDILRDSNQGKPFDREALDALKQLESGQKEGLTPSTHGRLLDVIGMAVKRKKEKHAGIGELANLKNRPMILIGDFPWTSQTAQGTIRHNLSRTLPPRLVSQQTTLSPGFSIPIHLLQIPKHFSVSQRRDHSTCNKTYTPNRRLTHSNITSATSQSQRLESLSFHLVSSLRDKSSASFPLRISNQPLTHLDSNGAARMVDISHKQPTMRSATAVATLVFSNSKSYPALSSATNNKGDAIAVARIAAIQAAKKTADLIPLAHPSLNITAVKVEIEPYADAALTKIKSSDCDIQKGFGGVEVRATVNCEGKTGVEMEALVAATVGSLTLYDMLKAVDKGMVIEGARVVEKKGGKSGHWKWSETKGGIVGVVETDGDHEENLSTQGQSRREEEAENTTLRHQNGGLRVETMDREPTSDVVGLQDRVGAASKSVGESRAASDVDEWNEGLAEEFSTSLSTKSGQ